MIVRVVCLDDDNDFASDIKTNINSLDPSFYAQLGTSITGIEVIPVTEPEDALKIINDKKQKIDLLILDIELKYNKLGHEEYDKLFYSGKAIPAIVVSAFANTPARKYDISSKGISVIIDKFDTIDLSEHIAKKICEVLQSPREKILKLRISVEKLRIHSVHVEIGQHSQSFEDWFKVVVTNNYPSGLDEAQIIQALANEIIIQARVEGDRNKGFKHDS